MGNVHEFEGRQKKLLNELGIYIHTYISSYIKTHCSGSVIAFVNSFIVCPESDEFDVSLFENSIKAKLHFEEHFSSSQVKISLNSVQLTDETSLEFFLSILPLHLSGDYDWFSIVMKDTSISYPNNDFDMFFSDLSAKDFEQLIKNFANAD